jgi:hypothetical protein
MRDVYSSANLTIAVHSARSCKDGFLGKQVFGQPEWQLEFSTTVPSRPDEASVLMILRRCLGRDEDGELVPFPEQDATFKTPLLERGWTFQEAIMPRRVVHFTGMELVWECESSWWCECGHIQKPDRSMTATAPMHHLLVKTNSAHARYSAIWTGKAAEPGNGSPKADTGIVWTDILKAYGERTFTNSSDKLIALSGVAKIFAEDIIKVC